MDAPQLRSNKFGRGEVKTSIVNGAGVTVDKNGKTVPESKRIAQLTS
jgi:hypothetical protein